MHRTIVIVIALAGCKSELNPAYCAAHGTDPRCVHAGDGNPAIDGDSDGNDAVTPAICLGEGAYRVCLRDMPTGDTPITSGFNTTNSNICLDAAHMPIDWTVQGQPDACFVVGATVTITNNMVFHGPRPIIFVATDTVTFSGQIDIAAHRGSYATNQSPPGFSVAACAPFATAGTNDANGGGGGAGGTFGTAGGNGGTGNNGQIAAGHAVDQPPPTVLHAGCPGQAGGTGDNQGTANLFAMGGWGGGTMYVLAGSSIVLSAGTIINASGAAGVAGNHRTGGGGGGSGGMIVLSAPAIMAGTNTFLMANGGGGSSGGTNSNDGKNGMDPVNGNPFMQAPGGVLTGGGTGGAGYAFDGTNALDGVVGGVGISGDGGGGGGGGAGLILAPMALGATAAVSPPIQIL
jgi:hypothetical protein